MKANFAASLALTVAFAGTSLAAPCETGQLDIKSDGNISRFAIEIADSPEERAQGLMDRSYMAQFSGMLFAYTTPRQVSFWMKNTLIPLDMLIIDPSGVVLRIHENAVPHDLTPIPGGDQIQYVLEINGGLARALNITEGAQVRHPEINNDLAIWPCSE